MIKNEVFYYTNTSNLLEILSTGLIKPPEITHDYYNDINEIDKNSIILFNELFSEESLKKFLTDEICFPIAITLNIEETYLNVSKVTFKTFPVKFRGFIPVSFINKILFYNEDILKEFRVREFSNINLEPFNINLISDQDKKKVKNINFEKSSLKKENSIFNSLSNDENGIKNNKEKDLTLYNINKVIDKYLGAESALLYFKDKLNLNEEIFLFFIESAFRKNSISYYSIEKNLSNLSLPSPKEWYKNKKWHLFLPLCFKFVLDEIERSSLMNLNDLYKFLVENIGIKEKKNVLTDWDMASLFFFICIIKEITMAENQINDFESIFLNITKTIEELFEKGKKNVFKTQILPAYKLHFNKIKSINSSMLDMKDIKNWSDDMWVMKSFLLFINRKEIFKTASWVDKKNELNIKDKEIFTAVLLSSIYNGYTFLPKEFKRNTEIIDFFSCLLDSDMSKFIAKDYKKKISFGYNEELFVDNKNLNLRKNYRLSDTISNEKIENLGTLHSIIITYLENKKEALDQEKIEQMVNELGLLDAIEYEFSVEVIEMTYHDGKFYFRVKEKPEIKKKLNIDLIIKRIKEEYNRINWNLLSQNSLKILIEDVSFNIMVNE